MPFFTDKLKALARSVLYRTRKWKYAALSNNTQVTGRANGHQPVLCAGRGRITIGKNVTLGVFWSPHFWSTYAYLEARNPTATLAIGDNTQINNNFCAIAEHCAIAIGSDCRIGTNVVIFDSNFHGLHSSQRDVSRPDQAAPVTIGDQVFIGANVTLLKGTTIGSGSVVSAGAVVRGRFSEDVIIAGNPATVVGTIKG